jgi:type IV pilus assembly protein PilM
VTQRVVALDFGSTGVRAVQVSASKKQTKVEAVAAAPLPRGAIVNGEIRDAAAVTATLTDLWETAGFKTKRVVFAVASDASVFVRQMELDWLDAKQFEEDLRHEVATVTDIAEDKLAIDYHLQADTVVEGTEEIEAHHRVRALAVAATTEMLDPFVAAAQDAGLLPLRVELGPFALLRATAPLPIEEGVAEAIVEIGGDVMTVVVHQGGQPRFIRILSGVGGNQVTQTLARTFSWSQSDAEGTKRALGIRTHFVHAPITESVFDVADLPATAATSDHEAHPVIEAAAAGTIAEIRASLHHFLASVPEVTALARVVLSGGGSLLGGLSTRLESELRIPVEFIDPLTQVTVSPKVALPTGITPQQLTVPIGLALGVSR